MMTTSRIYAVRPRKDKRGVDLISDVLPFGRLWYLKVSDAIGYAKFRSRSHDAVIRVYDEADNVIETHEHAGEFKEPLVPPFGGDSASQNALLRRNSIHISLGGTDTL